jgi:Phage integrase family
MPSSAVQFRCWSRPTTTTRNVARTIPPSLWWTSGWSLRLPARLTLASLMLLPSSGCLVGRSALPLDPGGRWTPWHATRPQGASDKANEVGHASPRGPMAAQEPDWLAAFAAGGRASQGPSGQLPSPWARWKIEAPTARAACCSSQAQPVRLSTSCRCGVEGLRFHDLRLSVATLALAAGANTRELMERMGHTSPAVALRYQHVMAGRDQAIAAALDELAQVAASLYGVSLDGPGLACVCVPRRRGNEKRRATTGVAISSRFPSPASRRGPRLLSCRYDRGGVCRDAR